MNKVRDISIDNIKAFAIFLVVLGHSLQYIKNDFFWGADKEYENYLFRCIYMFHMPLFVFLSGIYHKNNLPFVNFFVKNINRFIIPMIFWSLIGIIFDYFFISNEISLKRYIDVFMLGWWFIWCIVECRFTLYLFCQFKFVWMKILFLLFIYIVLPYFPIPRMNLFLSLFPFYFLAYYIYKNKNVVYHSLNKRRKIIGIVLSLMLFGVFFIYWDSNFSIYQWNPKLLTLKNYWYFISRIIVGLSSIFLLLLLFKKYINKSYNYTKLGRDILGIYILQYFYCALLRKYIFEFDNVIIYYINSFLFAYIWVFLSQFLIEFINKSNFLKRYLLGKIGSVK